MVEDAPSPDFPEFKDETVLVWNSIAEWWDDAIGDGNDFQTVLIEPATERMLDLQPERPCSTLPVEREDSPGAWLTLTQTWLLSTNPSVL